MDHVGEAGDVRRTIFSSPCRNGINGAASSREEVSSPCLFGDGDSKEVGVSLIKSAPELPIQTLQKGTYARGTKSVTTLGKCWLSQHDYSQEERPNKSRSSRLSHYNITPSGDAGAVQMQHDDRTRHTNLVQRGYKLIKTLRQEDLKATLLAFNRDKDMHVCIQVTKCKANRHRMNVTPGSFALRSTKSAGPTASAKQGRGDERDRGSGEDKIQDQSLRNEVTIMKKLEHDNVINFVEHFIIDRQVYLCTEYYCGSLEQLLRFYPSKMVPEKTCKFYFLQMIQALDYVQGKLIAHRNINTKSWLIDSRSRVKLCKFSFALELYERFQTCRFTEKVNHLKEVPEVKSRGIYKPVLVDVWMLGKLLLQFVNGKATIDDSGRISGIQHASKSLHELLIGMLSPADKYRYSVGQILLTSWVNEGSQGFSVRSIYPIYSALNYISRSRK